MNDTPEVTEAEKKVLEKASRAKSDGDNVRLFRLTGEEAEAAKKMIHGWGPHHPHGPWGPWGPRWGPGPYVGGWYDAGEAVVLSGITEAGLMVLDSILHPDKPQPPPAPPIEEN